MATSSKMTTNLALVLILCLLVMQETSECGSGYGCFCVKAALNRKVMADMEENKEVVAMKGSLDGSKGNGIMVGWELRTVPSGPDPLHHNGHTPNKPRTP